MKKDRKDQIGQEFGQLILKEVIEISTKSNRISHSYVFHCKCGVVKTMTTHNSNKIFTGDTVSCGCVKKKKWAKAYYTWKNSYNKDHIT